VQRLMQASKQRQMCAYPLEDKQEAANEVSIRLSQKTKRQSGGDSILH